MSGVPPSGRLIIRCAARDDRNREGEDKRFYSARSTGRRQRPFGVKRGPANRRAGEEQYRDEWRRGVERKARCKRVGKGVRSTLGEGHRES